MVCCCCEAGQISSSISVVTSMRLNHWKRAIARFPDVKRAGAAPTTVNGRDGLGVVVVSQGFFDKYAAVAALERIVRCEGVVRFVVVDELPVLESGKLNRLAIAKMTRDT